MATEKGWTLKNAIDRAISMEDQSHSLYDTALTRVLSPGSKILLRNLANDELQHKAKLQKIRESGSLEQLESKTRDIADLQILDKVEDIRLSEDATYQEILIFAGKREKETHEYYLELSKRLSGTTAGDFFGKLAQEELGHKNKIEREYESVVMKEG